MNLYNIEMEASVLGTFLGNEDILLRLIDQVTPESFFEPLNQDIFRYMQELVESGDKISPYRLYNKYQAELGEENKHYISSLMGRARPVAIKDNVTFLNELHHKRRLQQICTTAIEHVNDDKETNAIAGNLVDDVMQIITGTDRQDKTMMTTLEEIYEQVSSATPAYKAKTGLRVVDIGTGGGLQKGRVYCFMAAAKQGKTMIAATISNNLNDNGHKHLYVCAEMGAMELVQRMLGQRMGIAADSFAMPSSELKNAVGAKIPQIKNNVFFEDEPAIDFETLKRVIIKYVFKHKIEGFILDYFQLVSGQQRHETQAQHYENIANWVHQICKKYNIWCILLAQTNDDGQVLGSRGINRACDQGYLLERPVDSNNDPKGNHAWLKMRFSRYTKIHNLGNAKDPSLLLHENGTHFIDFN